MNENLGQIEDLLGDIKDNTANASGSGDGPSTNDPLPSVGDEPSGTGTAANTGSDGAANGLEDALGTLISSIGSLMRSYDIGNANSSLTWSFNLGARMGGTHQITLEPYAEHFDAIRLLILAVVSIWYVNALIKALREAFV
jgi:hypothetical protein